MRKVCSAANRWLEANRLRARPVIRGSFFMVGFSRVVVGLGKIEERDARLFCTYNSILDFYVFFVNRASADLPRLWPIGKSGRNEVLRRVSSRASSFPQGFCFVHKFCDM
jgi:hypothetical protein